MSRFWSFSELFDQMSARFQRSWSGSHSVTATQAILLAIALAMAALSLALGSPLLFLLGVVQGVVVFQLRADARSDALKEARESVTATMTGLRRRLPSAGAVCRVGGQIGTVIYRVLYRATMCLLISLAAGLATLSAFVLNQADLWRWTALQTAGPPLGAVLVTALIILFVLLMSSWIAIRRPLLPR